MSGVFQWSTTAASNATADPTVDWSEGQAPSTVNNSARALMASVAKWRNDLSGATASTGGTSTAYTLTTQQGFTSLSAMHGQHFAVIPHVTNGSSPTLAVDGLTAQAIVIDGVTALPAGSFNQSGIYVLTYYSNISAFVVHGLYSANTTFASGTLMLFQQTSAPTGWTKQTTHNDKALRVVSGTASSGGTTAFTTAFASGNTGSYTLTTTDIPSHSHSVSITSGGHSASHTHDISSGSVSGTVGAVGGTNTNIGTTNQYRASDGSGGAVSQTPSWSGSLSGSTGAASADHTHLVSGNTGNAGSGGGHTHSLSLAVQYVDLIIAAKN